MDSIAGDPDHVHLPRGQVGGPAQPERGAQLPPPPLRARTQALRARTQALRARTQAIRTRTHDLILLLAEIELFLYSIFLRRVTTVASSQKRNILMPYVLLPPFHFLPQFAVYTYCIKEIFLHNGLTFSICSDNMLTSLLPSHKSNVNKMFSPIPSSCI